MSKNLNHLVYDKNFFIKGKRKKEGGSLWLI